MKVSSSSSATITSVRSSLLLAILTVALYFAPAYGGSCSCDPCVAEEGTWCDGFALKACSECCGGSYWGDASGNPCDHSFFLGCSYKYCKKGNPFHCCGGGGSTVARPRPQATPPPTGAPSTGINGPLFVASVGEDPNLAPTGAWDISQALPLDSGSQVFNTIIIESDWHIKRPADLRLDAYGTSVCEWSHPLGGDSFYNCNDDVFDFLQNGSEAAGGKECVVGLGSFSLCKLSDTFDFSDIEHFDLNVLIPGGKFEGQTDFVIRKSAWFVLMD